MLKFRALPDHPCCHFAAPLGRQFRRVALAAILLTSAGLHATAAATPSASPAEARAARALDEAAKSGPVALRGFLYQMPKGADLHIHLDGAVYAETFLRDAAEDGLCVDPVALALVKPIAQTRSLPPQPVCGEGTTS
jgi:adenosine deaminase